MSISDLNPKPHEHVKWQVWIANRIIQVQVFRFQEPDKNPISAAWIITVNASFAGVVTRVDPQTLSLLKPRHSSTSLAVIYNDSKKVTIGTVGLPSHGAVVC